MGHLSGSRRQADHVEIDPTEKLPPTCGRRRRHPFFLERLQNERINRVLYPCPPLYTWGARTSDRLNGPERFATAVALGCLGPIGALLHPECECFDLPAVELARRRHFEVGVRVGNRFDQPAGFRLAGDDCRTKLSAFQESCQTVNAQATLLLFGPMAGAALIDQEGSDARLEELRASIISCGTCEGCQAEHGSHHEADCQASPHVVVSLGGETSGNAGSNKDLRHRDLKTGEDRFRGNDLFTSKEDRYFRAVVNPRRSRIWVDHPCALASAREVFTEFPIYL